MSSSLCPPPPPLPGKIHSVAGDFSDWACLEPKAQPMVSTLYFISFTIVTALVRA